MTGTGIRKGPVAVIGLGSMGHGMALNLMRGGYEVRGYDVLEAAMVAYRNAGGITAATPEEAAAGCDTLLLVVFDRAQAEVTLFGARGVLEALLPGSAVVVHTTMSPAAMVELGQRIEVSGHVAIDAPVTGGRDGADAGTLTVICSGPEAQLDALAPLFRAMGRLICPAGDRPGAASAVKMVNQLMTGVNLAATAEAMALVRAMGADPDTVIDVILSGTGASRAFESRARVMLGEVFDQGGMVDILTKDLDAVVEFAGEHGVDAVLARTALSRYQHASRAGFGREDSAAVVKTYLSREDGDYSDA